MPKSRPTFTFLLVLIIAGATVYGAVTMNRRANNAPGTVVINTSESQLATKKTNDVAAEPANLDTSTWKDYIDRTYFLSFKYPPHWQIETFPNRAGFYIIALEPTGSSDHIRIYISPDDYFALAGLPYKKDTLAGAKALNVNDMLIGVKYAAQYYTFDLGSNPTLQPQFKTILSTVAFSK